MKSCLSDGEKDAHRETTCESRVEAWPCRGLWHGSQMVLRSWTLLRWPKQGSWLPTPSTSSWSYKLREHWEGLSSKWTLLPCLACLLQKSCLTCVGISWLNRYRGAPGQWHNNLTPLSLFYWYLSALRVDQPFSIQKAESRQFMWVRRALEGWGQLVYKLIS